MAISGPVRGTWQDAAACLGAPLSLFFPEAGVHPDAAITDYCARCPVTEPCRTTAAASKIDDGVWGATTPDERRAARSTTRRRQMAA